MGLGFLLTRLQNTDQEPGVARPEFTQMDILSVTCPGELLGAVGGL